MIQLDPSEDATIREGVLDDDFCVVDDADISSTRVLRVLAVSQYEERVPLGRISALVKVSTSPDGCLHICHFESRVLLFERYCRNQWKGQLLPL